VATAEFVSDVLAISVTPHLVNILFSLGRLKLRQAFFSTEEARSFDGIEFKRIVSLSSETKTTSAHL